jgi:RNA ligase (TIGR02306 family)
MTTTMPAPVASPEITRALATIEIIDSITPIQDADAIATARIRGWDVVVSADWKAGDFVVYLEVDSLVPVTDTRFAFLEKRGVRTDTDGRTGHVLKTARFRGQYSQGLALPLSDFPEFFGLAQGDDVTAQLDIVKWDPPIPAEIAGMARGSFPNWISHTGEDRIQNNPAFLGATGGNWIATEKVDGTSLTAWITPTDQGVAMRNYDLVDNDNRFWQIARRHNLHDVLRTLSDNATVQGEMFGPGVTSKNPLGVKEIQFRVFTLYVNGQELPRGEWPQEFLDIAVPIHDIPVPATLDEALDQVDGLKSLISKDRNIEGIVWRLRDSATFESNGRIVRASVKVISRKYLLRNS